MPNPENLKPFKKGIDERRNTTGKNRKLPELKVIIADLLSKEKNGQSLIDGLMTVVVNKALKGDLKATQMLLDYYYGKATQRTEITGSDGEKIQFKIDVIKSEETKPFEPE